MSRVKIGNAKYGSTQKKFWKLKDGDSVYGILPPIGDLAEDGVWSVYYKIHYGYKNAAGKARPFQSCLEENRKTKMVEVPDAACERLALLKGQLEAAKKSGNEKAKEALFKLVGGTKSIYNLDNNHYVNAIDLQGNIGVLKLRHKAFLALKAEIDALRKKNINPLGKENCRYFVFTRTGNAMETSFKVSVYKKTMNIEGVGEVEKDVVYSLTDDILDRLGSEAAKLDVIFKYPNSEQVAQIVKESNLTTGVSPNIDEILGYTKSGATESEDVGDTAGDEDPFQETTAVAKNATAATTTAQQATPATTVQTKVETTPVVLEKPKTETTKTAAAAPQTTADNVNSMSDKDFLASLGIQT